MAGRFERVTLTHWSALSLAEVFRIPHLEAVQTLVSTGAYPGAVTYRADRTRWSAYVRDAWRAKRPADLPMKGGKSGF
jgi:hypothetical protein